MFGNRRRDERGSGTTHYRMHQKLVAIGDDYWIEDEHGQRAYKVNGKALRVRDTFLLEDTHGHEILKSKEKLLHIRDTMAIEDVHGHRVATVKKALISPFRERWSVNVEGGPELEVQGNIVDHEYRIEQGRSKVAEISKRWFRVRDTYGVEVGEGQDPALILTIAAVLDTASHPAA